jgi:serine protease AprX
MKQRPIGVGLVAVVAAAGLASAPADAGGATDEPVTTVMYKSEFRPDGTIARTQVKLAAASEGAPSYTKPAEPAPPTPAKLDPGLAAAVAKNPAASTRQRVIVTFQDDVKVPRFPDPDPALPRTGSANALVQAQSNAIVTRLTAQRQPGYQALSSELAQLGVRPLGTYWLLKAMQVEASLSALPALARRSDVTYVEPADSGTGVPADTDPANDEEDARALMGSDTLLGQGANTTPAYIGLLDSGVRATHVLFNNPVKPWIREDLTNTTNPDPSDGLNHGTSTAAILTGNSNLGSAYRGVTGITVDSFKVFPTGVNSLDVDAAMRGFQRAVQVGDRVIVAEMQAGGTEISALSTAADNAFDAGAMVIAANGNSGPNRGTVKVPAVAQKVLGIGAVEVKTQVTPSYQSRGPAPDGRTKPDLQAPTNVETASSASDTATRVLDGTSAATPNAAGAAALARDIWRGTNIEVDPGMVYAYMLATGNLPGAWSHTNGAGLINIPASGSAWTAPETVRHRQTLEIPFPIQGTDLGRRVKMAIWWPEQPATHNDIDLALVDPNGVERSTSISGLSVFERISFGPLTAGNWKVRISGFNVPSGSQRVN